jgi:hypothetical protein
MLRVRQLIGASLLAATVISGCSDDPTGDPPRWVLDVADDLPSALSEVGLFADMSTRDDGEGLIAYSPPHALFSNGLGKERHLFVPEGAAIDPVESGWDFPLGTVLAKTFTIGAAAMPVETRLLFRRTDGWDYALYAWRPDASEADLMVGNWPEKVVELEGGVTHTLPARLDCRVCHETSEESFGSPVLGVGAYQLSTPLAMAAPFSSAPEAIEVTGRTPAETAALGYFIGNCTTCHTGGDGTNAAFSLYPNDSVERTVDQETESETGEGIRVVPGDPAASVLFITVVEAREPDYAGAFKVMPPIGLNITDPEARPILSAWIEEL